MKLHRLPRDIHNLRAKLYSNGVVRVLLDWRKEEGKIEREDGLEGYKEGRGGRRERGCIGYRVGSRKEGMQVKHRCTLAATKICTCMAHKTKQGRRLARREENGYIYTPTLFPVFEATLVISVGR